MQAMSLSTSRTAQKLWTYHRCSLLFSGVWIYSALLAFSIEFSGSGLAKRCTVVRMFHTVPIDWYKVLEFCQITGAMLAGAV
jgi:hypothetical protein